MTANPQAVERALHCLLEGCSIRSTERLTGLNRNTIMRLSLVAGELSTRLMDARMRGLSSRYLQIDEIWTFVGKKRRAVRMAIPLTWLISGSTSPLTREPN